MADESDSTGYWLKKAGFNPDVMIEKMRVMLARIPQEDQDCLFSMLDSWLESDPVAANGTASKQIIDAFDIARKRLPMGKDLLMAIYTGARVPKPLRNIIQPFILGTANQAETEKKLDEVKAVLEKWLPQMFEMFGIRQ